MGWAPPSSFLLFFSLLPSPLPTLCWSETDLAQCGEWGWEEGKHSRGQEMLPHRRTQTGRCIYGAKYPTFFARSKGRTNAVVSNIACDCHLFLVHEKDELRHFLKSCFCWHTFHSNFSHAVGWAPPSSFLFSFPSSHPHSPRCAGLRQTSHVVLEIHDNQ